MGRTMGGPQKQNSSSSSASNVRVVARIRPLAKYEIENGSKQIVTSLPGLNTVGGGDDGEDGDDIKVPTEPEILQVQPSSSSAEKRWFELDAVLDDNSTQRETYIKSGAQQAVTEDIFKGFNCTILAYGQTGSGKTFTMGSAAGTSTEIGEMEGIIPRACADLFQHIDTRCDGNAQVELSYLEIYNEEMRDLLVSNNGGGTNNNSNKKGVELKIRETLNGEVYVGGLSSRPVSSSTLIGEYMEEASQRRVVASTKMNATSSRSHAICVLRIKGVLEDSTKFEAKLTLVDLAGSERIKKTGAEGGRRQEGININKGLFILGQVVSALSETRKKYKRKPPYRDSKLTRLLQDSLGGNSRTIMLACVSPADFNLDETITTLRYATNARNIKNTATRNVIKSLSPEEAAKLQRENQLLQAQVKELQETIRKMAATTDSSTVDSSSSSSSCNTDDESSSVVSSPSEDRSSGTNAGADGGETTMSQQKARLSALENNNCNVHASQRIMESMAQDAIELPDLKKKIAILEEEIASKHDVEAENMELHEELQDIKADADSARLAANKMSKIMEQLQLLKDDEIDKKKMEHDHIKVEEAWVSFVFQVLQTNNEHLKKLQDDFGTVTNLVDSPEFMGLKERKGFMSMFRQRIGGGGERSPTSISSIKQQPSNGDDNSVPNSSNSDDNNGNNKNNKNKIQRSDSNSVNTEETKQQAQERDDPTNIMKVIVNLKDELKAAHEVIRQQRVQVKTAMKSSKEAQEKNSSSATKNDGGEQEVSTAPSEESAEVATPVDSPTISALEYRKLKERYTQLEIDRCWGEFQLRDRITNDALKFHRRIRAVMQKANSSDSKGGSTSYILSNGGTAVAAQNEDQQQQQHRTEEEFKMKVDTELRSRLKTVADHLLVFKGRLVEMEKHVAAEMNSLGAIRNSLRVQQNEMELEIGTSEIEKCMLDKDDNNLLEQLTSLLVGPVKNLGSYQSESIPDNDENNAIMI